MPNLIANRNAKAQRFADRIAKAHDAEGVAGWTDADWTGCADRYDESAPSAETRAIILDILFARERDPFAGL